MGKNRLEAFSDGVIAIIITIMVLELKVPHDSNFRALIPLWPVFMSYVLSFIYVGIYWNKLQYGSCRSHKRCAMLGTLGFAALVSGCTPNINKAGEELKIRQAVLRYQFEHNASASHPAIFCIAISEGKTEVDAPANLIRGLNDATHKVVKSSDCDGNEGNGVIERSSGKLALMLNIGPVKWLTPDEVVVDGGYYEASLSASGNTYRLKKVSGVWRVIKDEMNWIS
jgi:hypothetical protein